jgi:hypothetical protein
MVFKLVHPLLEKQQAECRLHREESMDVRFFTATFSSYFYSSDELWRFAWMDFGPHLANKLWDGSERFYLPARCVVDQSTHKAMSESTINNDQSSVSSLACAKQQDRQYERIRKPRSP